VKNHYNIPDDLRDRDVIPDVSFSLSATAALRITANIAEGAGRTV